MGDQSEEGLEGLGEGLEGSVYSRVQCVPKVLCVLVLACTLMVGGRRLTGLSLRSLSSHFYKLSMSVSLHVSALFISADGTLFLCPSTPALILTLRFSTTRDLAHFPNVVQTFWGDAPDLTILLSFYIPLVFVLPNAVFAE